MTKVNIFRLLAAVYEPSSFNVSLTNAVSDLRAGLKNKTTWNGAREIAAKFEAEDWLKEYDETVKREQKEPDEGV